MWDKVFNVFDTRITVLQLKLHIGHAQRVIVTLHLKGDTYLLGEKKFSTVSEAVVELQNFCLGEDGVLDLGHRLPEAYPEAIKGRVRWSLTLGRNQVPVNLIREHPKRLSALIELEMKAQFILAASEEQLQHI